MSKDDGLDCKLDGTLQNIVKQRGENAELKFRKLSKKDPRQAI